MGTNGSKQTTKQSKRKLTAQEKIDLYEAIENGNDELAKELIEKMEDVNEEIAIDFGKFKSALTLSCRNRMVDIVKKLIELGADVNAIDKFSLTPLVMATCNGHIEIVQILISAGSDINYMCVHGSSALSYSVNCDNSDVFELLISCGINIDKCGGKSLINASTTGKINIIERLLNLGVNVNYIDSSTGYTSLHWACRNNNLELIELLLENGADTNLKENRGCTPIQLTKTKEIEEFMNNYNSTQFILK